jgi:hypothetical protein
VHPFRQVPATFALVLAGFALAAPAPVTAQSGAIEQVWVDYDVWDAGLKGMRIHVRFHVDGMRGSPGRAVAYFYFDGGTPLDDFDGSYNTYDGQVSVGVDFTPPYENTTYNDFLLFMPYDQLHMAVGNHDLEFHVEIFALARNFSVAQSTTTDFSLDQPAVEPTPQVADAWLQQVEDQLYAAQLGFAKDGYIATHTPVTGSLRDGESTELYFDLAAGVSYFLVGVCDDDCTDLDIVLYDDNGNVIDSDYALDAVPIVAVTPSWSARFTVEVSMPGCAIDPCRFGVGAYGD